MKFNGKNCYSNLIGLLSVPAFAEFVTIGTGGVTGTYYPTRELFCRLVNQHKKDTKLDVQLNQLWF